SKEATVMKVLSLLYTILSIFILIPHIVDWTWRSKFLVITVGAIALLLIVLEAVYRRYQRATQRMAERIRKLTDDSEEKDKRKVLTRFVRDMWEYGTMLLRLCRKQEDTAKLKSEVEQ